MKQTASKSTGQYALTGAIGGLVSTIVFTIVHDIFISDIWLMLLPMSVAGAICGASIGWSFALLVDATNLGGWLKYNLLYVLMFFLLGVVSSLVFEPVTTIAALIAENGPPDDLIRQALPMTILFTLGMAIVVTLLYGRNWSRFGAILLTCTVLVLLLGLNVSTIGLVSIPRGSFYLVLEMFGLILLLDLVYVSVFAILIRNRLLHPAPNT